MSDDELPDSIARNVAEWTEANAQYTDAQAERAWARLLALYKRAL